MALKNEITEGRGHSRKEKHITVIMMTVTVIAPLFAQLGFKHISFLIFTQDLQTNGRHVTWGETPIPNY